MMRGLTIDKQRGNIVKLDRHKYVKVRSVVQNGTYQPLQQPMYRLPTMGFESCPVSSA